MVFCASTMDGRSYHWDYALDVAGPINRMYGQNIRRDSPIVNCVAIGYVDKGRDQWPGNFGEVNLECVGIPAYPGAVYPRVVGFARRRGERPEISSSLKEIKGNALSTRREGRILLAHVVNDKARSWGAGFGKQLAEKYPNVAQRFRSAMESPDRPRLGSIFSTCVNDQLTVVQLVAQSGYGASETPRLRYVALQESLRQVRELAKNAHASVQMPPIGTGYGGAPWEFVKELVEQELVRHGVAVTVYRLRDQQRLMPAQPNLF
jgi:O-acetyl-ADP-ribose deacetylase (regulator of RNase III)